MTISSAIGNYYDQDYDTFLIHLQKKFLERIQEGAEPLFTTDAGGLFEVYLSSFPEGAERQHHNCSACRHFLNRFAGLVTIDEKGRTTPAVLGDSEATNPYETAFASMIKIVRKAKVTGIFLSSEAVLGYPVTGIWRHLAVVLPKSILHDRVTMTADQMMAERREDFNYPDPASRRRLSHGAQQHVRPPH